VYVLVNGIVVALLYIHYRARLYYCADQAKTCLSNKSIIFLLLYTI